jgi:hypothetical protein
VSVTEADTGLSFGSKIRLDMEIPRTKLEKGVKENINTSKNVYFFVKIRQKHTYLRPLIAGLLGLKPIFEPKTGVGLGLNWVCFYRVRGRKYCRNSLP